MFLSLSDSFFLQTHLPIVLITTQHTSTQIHNTHFQSVIADAEAAVVNMTVVQKGPAVLDQVSQDNNSGGVQ